MKNLILFSGGADSALLLYKLLNETEDKNTLLILCSQNRQWAVNSKQLILMQPLLKELKTYGDFEIIYDKVDENLINSASDDAWYCYSIKKYAPKFNDGTYDRYVTATSSEMANFKSMKNHDYLGMKEHFVPTMLFERLATRGECWMPFVSGDMYPNYNRWHLNKHLPSSLKSKSLYCFTIPNCGGCSKCLYDRKAIECIAEGWTAEEFQTWTKERARHYGGDRDASIWSWIHLEYGRTKNLPCGVAKEEYRNVVMEVNNEATFREWFDTIEYTPITDSLLLKWNLTKEDWNPALMI